MYKYELTCYISLSHIVNTISIFNNPTILIVRIQLPCTAPLPHCPTLPVPHSPSVLMPTLPVPHCPTAPLSNCLISYHTAFLSYCSTLQHPIQSAWLLLHTNTLFIISSRSVTRDTLRTLVCVTFHACNASIY